MFDRFRGLEQAVLLEICIRHLRLRKRLGRQQIALLHQSQVVFHPALNFVDLHGDFSMVANVLSLYLPPVKEVDPAQLLHLVLVSLQNESLDFQGNCLDQLAHEKHPFVDIFLAVHRLLRQLVNESVPEVLQYDLLNILVKTAILELPLYVHHL